jgi:hypothetical protein
MAESFKAETDDQLVSKIGNNQLQHFTGADRRCQGVELPQGVMLRYNAAESMFFFLETTVDKGKIKTNVYASDSPYDKKKSFIGEVNTAMFEEDADMVHLTKVEKSVRDWVQFVSVSTDEDQPFSSFSMDKNR